MRIRVLIPIFLGIAATYGLSYLLMKAKAFKIGYYALILFGVFMVGEVWFVSHQIMKASQVRYIFTGEYNPDREFRNISKLPRPNDAPETINFTYTATRMSLGWLRGFGDSHLPADTIRVGFDKKAYVGEFYQGRQAVRPLYWSPNKILFSGLRPNTPLYINLNPGRAWYNNGRQLFPQYKIVEPDKPFQVMPNSEGRVELTYQYPSQKLGIIGTLLFLVISVLVIRMNLSAKNI
jgi:hypothetical protein